MNHMISLSRPCRPVCLSVSAVIMGSVPGPLLLCLLLLGDVEGQEYRNEASGLSDYDGDPITVPSSSHPRVEEWGGIIPNQSVNSTDKGMRWSNSFDIILQNQIASYEDSRWLRNAEIIKNTLQDVELDFFNPAGFRILLKVGSIDAILEFVIHVKGIDDSDLGTFTATITERRGKLACLFPALKVRQGDEMHYRIVVLVDEGDFDVSGVLRIEVDSPIIRGYTTELVQFCPRTSPDVKLSTPRGAGHAVEKREATYRWSHQFSINSTYNEGFTSKTVTWWLGWVEDFKKKWERDLELHVVRTKLPGLIITIVDDRTINCEGDLKYVRFVAFDIKLNEEFKSFDSGDFSANATRTQERWLVHYPGLKLKEGDKVFYRMRVTLGSGKCSSILWDNTVRGKLVVTQENSNTGGANANPELTQFCPSSSPVRPQTSRGDVTGGRLTWTKKKYELDIEPTYPRTFSGTTGEKWRKDVQLLRTTLLEDIVLEILDPAGLRISISGDNITILAFKIKLNEGFQGLDFGENITRHKVNRWRYYYPNLKVREGDKVYYWMRVIFGKGMWDGNVKGTVEIIKSSKGCDHPNHGSCGDANPHLRVRGFKNNYASLTPSSLVAVRGGAVEEAFRWSLQLTIAPTSDGHFTPQSAQQWTEDAKRLRSAFEKSVDFKFSLPKGLIISIADNSMHDFSLRMELNRSTQFPDPESDNATSGVKVYTYAGITVKPGDKIDCYFGTPFIKHVVTGTLEIKDP